MEKQISIKDILLNDKYLVYGAILFVLCMAMLGITGNFLFGVIPFAVAGIIWLILDWRSFYFFFLFTIPLSAEVSVGSLSTTIPDEPLMWLFVPMTLFILLFNHRQLPKWFLTNTIIFVITLQFLWLIVAVVFSQNHFLSVKYLLSKSWFNISYLVLPAMLLRTKQDIKRIFYLLVIPILLHAVVVFVWHFFRNFDYWDSNEVVKPFYVNHVDHATVLSMVFPLVLTAYWLAKPKSKYKKIWLALLIFLIPAIFVAAARAAMLGVVFAFVVAFAIRIRLVNLLMPFFFVFVTSMVIYLTSNENYVKYRPNMKYTATQRTFEDLMTATFKGTDMSSMERFYRWIASVRMSREHPLVGVGPNNFYDNYKEHTSAMFRTWVSRNPERSTTHNYFLLMLVEQGWPAMLLYGLLILTLLAYSQKLYHRLKDTFYKKVTLGVIMMIAAAFVNNFFSELLETHKIGALFYLGIVILVFIDATTKSDKEAKHLL